MTRHLDARGTEHENASDLDISTKSNSADLATAIDVLNEDLIASEIGKRFPHHRIIGEESTGSGTVDPIDPNGENTWIIDPIDGTTNFASGLPLCCVSIGMCVGGVPCMGVAFAPATEELYVAVRGRGAYRNGVRLSGTGGGGGRAVATRKALSDSVVGFEFGYAKSEEGVDLMTGAVRRLLRHGVRATRSLGSGVLDLCYVASGRLDVVYAGVADEGWKPWDYCAGLVVANEAGCTMTHLIPRSGEDLVDGGSGEIRRGYEFNLLTRSVICGVNADIVEETRRVVLGL
jgi:fructose-1,6-bisphosphatase/inositol monophosphatase family enzyme